MNYYLEENESKATDVPFHLFDNMFDSGRRPL